MSDISSVTILAIDDEAFAQKFLARILKALGISNVLTCGNGAEGLDLLAESAEVIDLIICDIEMPEMDGYEFVRMLRYGTVPQYKDAPVLMLTGQDTQKNMQRAQIHKIDGFVVKPPTADALRAHIERALGIG